MSNVTMTTRFFKLAICRNFIPSEILATKRFNEMCDSNKKELYEFYGTSEVAIDYLFDQALFDMYRWSNWTAESDAKLSVSHLDYPEYYNDDLDDPFEELIRLLKDQDTKMRQSASVQ